VRIQDLVLQSDAVPAGPITKLEWHADGNIAAGTYKDFRVELCHTNLSALTNTFQTNYGGNTPVRVFYRSSHYVNPPAESWFGWPFDAPFEYNGRDNFIIEVWWEEDVGEGAAPTYITKIMSRGLYSSIRYGQPQHGYPNQGELMNYLHHMRITISGTGVEPTSLGRVKTLHR
jgi:hypothetical protein